MAITFKPEATLVSSLISVLEREQKTLVSDDVESIEILIDEKTKILQQISFASQERYKQLQAHGYAANEDGMLTLLKTAISDAMNNSWMDFQKSLAQAKELNRVNGVLINRHFNRNREMFNHLQGSHQGGHSASLIYGANGQQSAARYYGSSLII